MTERVAGLFERFGRVWRYLLVGGGVTFAYSLLTAAFVISLVIPDPVMASAAATIITQPFAFLAHRAVTYRDVTRDPGHWKRFAIFAASSFMLNLTVMKLADMLGWPFWTGLVFGWFVIPAANYLIGAIWVFRARHLMAMTSTDQPPAPDAKGDRCAAGGQ